MSWSQQQAALERYNYYGDSRVQESMRDHAFTIKSAGPDTTIIVPHECLRESEEDDDEPPLADEYEVRTVFCVCGMCSGSGKMTNPSIDAGGLTQEDFDEDPSFKEEYFSGRFDMVCSRCSGQRVAIDRDAAIKNLPQDVRERIMDFQRDLDEDLSMRLSEMRYGC